MLPSMWHNARIRALLLLVTAAVLWSSGGLLIKSVEWHPLAIAGARSAVAAAVIRIAFGRSGLVWSRAQILSAIGYTGMVCMFVSATKLTTAANAILLQYTAPIYVALLGFWLLRERPSRADWVTIAVVSAGMGLFFFDKMSPGGLLGNILSLGSGVSMALFVVCLRQQKGASPFGSVFLGNVMTFFIGTPFMFFGGPAPDAAGWAGIAALGVFQLGLSYVLYSIAIHHVSALEAVLIPVIEPVLNPIWVFFVLGEVPGPWSLAGGAVILVAVTARCAAASLEASSAASDDTRRAFR